jgi:predicted amidohydrolase YtcJ
LHDAHVHINYGEKILYPRIPDIRPRIGEWASVERMQEVIKRCLATGEGMRPGPEPRWLVLSGWISDVWDPPEFHKELIDAVAPNNPFSAGYSFSCSRPQRLPVVCCFYFSPWGDNSS